LLITGFYVSRMPLLLVGVAGFIALRHDGGLPGFTYSRRQRSIP
jgi:hypothetical protein